MFSLVVFHADDYLALTRDEEMSLAGRFFKITSRLPLEIQMVICHRMYGSTESIVISRDSEPGFHWLARASTNGVQ